MSANSYIGSPTHAMMTALTKLTKPLPQEGTASESPIATLQRLKKTGRTAVAQIVGPAWQTICAWRQANQPLRFSPHTPLAEDQFKYGFSRGLCGFCINVQAGQCTTLGAALEAQRSLPALEAAFLDADALASQTAAVNYRLTEEMLYSLHCEQLPEGSKQDPGILTALRRRAQASAAARFGSGFRFEDYLMEEIGPAFGINAGFIFVSLALLQRLGVPESQRFARATRIVRNSTAFLRDWATISTAVFFVLKQLQQLRSARSESLYGHGWDMSDPDCYQVAQLGDEFEHLEFDDSMARPELIAGIDSKIHEAFADVYHIGCGGLGMRTNSDPDRSTNLVSDSLIWSCEIATANAKYLRWDVDDF